MLTDGNRVSVLSCLRLRLAVSIYSGFRRYGTISPSAVSWLALAQERHDILAPWLLAGVAGTRPAATLSFIQIDGFRGDSSDRLSCTGGGMAQATVVLMCGVGSFLVGGDAVVIPCDHPASPLAQSGPAIVVPRIKTLGIKSVRPNLTEEEGGSAHQQQPGSAKRNAGQDQQKPTSDKGSGQH